MKPTKYHKNVAQKYLDTIQSTAIAWQQHKLDDRMPSLQSNQGLEIWLIFQSTSLHDEPSLNQWNFQQI